MVTRIQILNKDNKSWCRQIFFTYNYQLFSNLSISLPQAIVQICMMKTAEKVIIIGGGLSGLYLAYSLQKNNFSPLLLEASPRLGGRIKTIKGTLETPLELGATWFSDMHPYLLSLIEELGLTKYPQFSNGISLFQTKSFEPAQEFFVPESQSPSYRLAGGTQQLTDVLAEKLPFEYIKLNHKVIAINESPEGLTLVTDKGLEYHADRVVLCLPPQVAGALISFSPSLPEAIKRILPTVQTWMAGSIKFTLEYPEPFWRNLGYSGMLYSHSGIITEMYDHNSYENDRFGFTGFLNAGAASYTSEVRKELVLKQLAELLGEQAASPSAYFDQVWNDEFILAGQPIIQRPHQNNGHPLLQRSYMNGKLFFCGTETALEYSGYMEGAVFAAKELAERISS